MSSSRLVAGLLALALLAAGCGSTVRGAPGAETVSDAFDGGQVEGFTTPSDVPGMSAPGTAGPAGTATANSGATLGSTAAAAGPTGTSGPSQPGTAPGSAPAPADPTGPPPGSPGPGTTAPAGGTRPVAPGTQGITDDAITVGFTYVVNGGAANAAIGAAGISQGDGRHNFEVLAAHYNARGGAAGRMIEPVFHEMDAATPQTADQLEQEECTHFTQDNEVYAVWLPGRSDSAMACYDQAGVAFMESSGLSLSVDSTYRDFPRMMSINAPSLSSVGRFYAPGLDRIGFFEPETPVGEVKVGLLTFDQPRFIEAVEQSVIPAMQSTGRDFEDIVYLPFARTQTEVGPLQAAIANAVLRFGAADIDHVMIVEINALIALLFMQNAESQGYRPQYGLTTASGGMVLAGLVPPEQLENALTVGHYDMFDVPPEDYTPTPARAECDAIYDEAGITFADLNAQGLGHIACDSFVAFITAMDADTGPIDADSINRGLMATGGYDSALVGPTTFRADKRDGVSRYRGTRFDSSCTCFRAITDYFPIH